MSVRSTEKWLEGVEHARNNSKKSSCCDSASDDACYVWSHSVHQEEVLAICFLSNLGCYSGCHRYGRYTGSTDEWVDRMLWIQLVHKLCQEDTASCSDSEGNHTKEEDSKGLKVEESVCSHLGTYRETKTDGDDVHEGILHCIGKSSDDSALLSQVTEHKGADKWSSRRKKNCTDCDYHHREDDLFNL